MNLPLKRGYSFRVDYSTLKHRVSEKVFAVNPFLLLPSERELIIYTSLDPVERRALRLLLARENIIWTTVAGVTDVDAKEACSS